MKYISHRYIIKSPKSGKKIPVTHIRPDLKFETDVEMGKRHLDVVKKVNEGPAKILRDLMTGKNTKVLFDKQGRLREDIDIPDKLRTRIERLQASMNMFTKGKYKGNGPTASMKTMRQWGDENESIKHAVSSMVEEYPEAFKVPNDNVSKTIVKARRKDINAIANDSQTSREAGRSAAREGYLMKSPSRDSEYLDELLKTADTKGKSFDDLIKEEQGLPENKKKFTRAYNTLMKQAEEDTALHKIQNKTASDRIFNRDNPKINELIQEREDLEMDLVKLRKKKNKSSKEVYDMYQGIPKRMKEIKKELNDLAEIETYEAATPKTDVMKDSGKAFDILYDQMEQDSRGYW